MKAVGEDQPGTFEGHGSIFGNVDSCGDIVVRGAFRESLTKNGLPAMLWQHNMFEPIGVFTEVREDETGLYVKGQIEIESDMGKRAYNLLKMGGLKGLSIGYRVQDFTVEQQNQRTVRKLEKLELLEISLVTFPANKMAVVTGVKSLDQIGEIKEVEALLQAAGFSGNEAKTIISKVKAFTKAAHRDDAPADPDGGIDGSQRDVTEATAIAAKIDGFLITQKLDQIINITKGN